MANQQNVNEVMKAAAQSFTSEDVSYNVLSEGTHRCLATKIRVAHSFLKADGSPKDGPFEWKTPTPLVAITFADVKGAVVMERFHLRGFKKYEDLTAEQKEDEKYSSSENGVALLDGDRIEDPAKTKSCISILSGTFSALGLPAGSTLDDLQAVVDAREAEVDITVKKASGGDFMEVVKVAPVKEVAEIAEFK